MTRARPLEVRAVVEAIEPLLLVDWDTHEELAEAQAIAAINAIDECRASRTSYIGVMKFGTEKGSLFYVGIGPYPGQKSAQNALIKHPAVSSASGRAVVPIISEVGYTDLLKRVG